MNNPKIYFILTLYALLYASTVSLLTYTFATTPTLLRIEFAIYDPMQSWAAMQDRMTERYQNNTILRSYTADLFCINLDGDYFNEQSESIHRQKLRTLLDYLNDNTSPKAVFLNFLFTKKKTAFNPSQDVDSLLMKSIKKFKSPLIMPNSLLFQLGGLLDKTTVSDAFERYALVYETPTSGFAVPAILKGDNCFRYWQYQTDDEVLPSVIKVLIDTVYGQDLHYDLPKVPHKFEINYLLKDSRPKDKLWILDDADASALLNMNKKEVANMLNNKVLFIGLFDDRKDDYGIAIDKFTTPLGDSTSSIFLLLNTYLNVVGATYLQKIEICWVFSSNLIIAFLGIFYNYIKQKYSLNNFVFRKKAIEMVFSGVLSIGILWYLFTCYYLKFPFVFTLLFYVKNQYFYQCFKNQFS